VQDAEDELDEWKTGAERRSDVNKDFTFKAKHFAFKSKGLAFTQLILTRKIKPLFLSRLSTDCRVTSMFHSKQHLMTNNVSRNC